MQAALQQAALPEPFRVLGRDLHPYTIGHDILLNLFESGFAIGSSKGPTFDDLLISVWICSHKNYASVFDALCSPFTRLKIKAWGIRCGLFDYGEAFDHFNKYIQANTAEPGYWIESRSNGGRPSGIPFSQFLKVTMRREFGMSESEALDTPYCQANFNYLTILETGGKIRLMSQEDMTAIQMANDPDIERKLQALAQRICAN
jgi:hypothetical protein